MARKHRSQEVRIIGGKWKGRKLRFRGDNSLRPTLGRTRETLFNWLRPEIRSNHCLDLFAGSGILGFEALSLGAAHCTFVDRHRVTCAALTSTVNELGCSDQAEVHCTQALSFLKHTKASFDLIFLDPPYANIDLLTTTLSEVTERGLLSGRLYIETRESGALCDHLALLGYKITRQSHAGETTAYLCNSP
jgi:16S rRNA (guanine966-N2)-methyltransferase